MADNKGKVKGWVFEKAVTCYDLVLYESAMLRHCTRKPGEPRTARPANSATRSPTGGGKG